MSQNTKDIWMKVGVIFAGVLCISVLASAVIFCGQVLQMPARMDRFEAREAALDVRESRIERDLQLIASQGGFRLPGDGSDLSDDDYSSYPVKSNSRVAEKSEKPIPN